MYKGFWDKLKKPIIGLSPMDGITDAAFRGIPFFRVFFEINFDQCPSRKSSLCFDNQVASMP